MSEHVCKCKRLKSSIHGNCNFCFGKLPSVQNVTPQYSPLPTTARGKRRSKYRRELKNK
jgi:hypothetical protein